MCKNIYICSDGNAVANEDMFRAIEIFKSKELWELDFFLTGWTNPDIDYHITISKMIQAAEERKDCVVCVSVNSIASFLANQIQMP